MPSTATDRLNGLSTSVAVKAPVRAVSTINLTLAGLQTVGGVALAAGDRVLVKDQSTASQNGIYEASTGTWSRAADFDGNRDVRKGTMVVQGADTSLFYRVTTADPITIGTSSISFEAVVTAVTQAAIGAALNPRTSAEVAASVTPQSYAYSQGDARRYGAVGDDSTDNTTALQNWLNVGAQGVTLYLPAGVYRHDDLSVDTLKGFLIRGDSTGDYGTSAGSDPTRGSILKYTGNAAGLTIDSSAVTTSPKYVTLDGLTFLGNASATDAIVITRATWCRIRHCTVTAYDATGANGLRLTIGSGTFTGGIRVYDCDFKENYRDIYVDSYPVNIVTVRDCGFHSSQFNIVLGPDTSTINFVRMLSLTGNDFEETVKSCILVNGGVAVARIVGNYIEQNDSSENDPRIWLANTGTSPLSQVVKIQDNVFSKLLNNASESLIRVRNIRGLKVQDNWLIDTGSETDRYSVELVSTVSEYVVEMMLTVFGDAGYPNRIGGANWFQTVEDYATPRVFRSSGSTVFHVSAATAKADTNAQGYLGETLNQQSGSYTLALVDRDAVVTNGSNGGPTYTIPANATTAFPVGSHIDVVNDSSASMTLARAGTVANVLASTATDQDVTIASRGVARLRKIGTNRWFTDGVGLS
jgi:hypothetical protein